MCGLLEFSGDEGSLIEMALFEDLDLIYGPGKGRVGKQNQMRIIFKCGENSHQSGQLGPQ